MIIKHQIPVRAELLCEFENFEHWVSKATSRLAGFSKDHYQLLCFDNEGYLCQLGKDFMAARDCNRFPVTAYLVKLSRNAPTMPYESWRKLVMKEKKHYRGFNKILKLSEESLRHLWAVGESPEEALNVLSTVS